MTRSEQIKDGYLELIIDLAYDYDGCTSVEDLKALIDEIVEYAKWGYNDEDKHTIYVDADGTERNILLEKLYED